MKQKKSLEEQVKEAMPEFYEEVQTLAETDMVGRLAQTAKDSEAVFDAKEADEALQEAKQHATQLGAPYSDSLKAIRLRSRYLIKLLKDRGAK